jgi:hypothetical protein
VWQAVGAHDGGIGKLVFKQRAGVEEEPAEQGRLSVVHGAGDNKAEELLGEVALNAGRMLHQK